MTKRLLVTEILLWSVGRHGEQGADIEPFSSGRWRCARTAGAATREIAIGPFLVERCILLSRMTVGTALSSAKCTFRRRGSSGEAGATARGPRSLAGAPVVVADRPVAPLPGARGGTGMSKSATKARIKPERAQRIVDIPRFCSRPIPARGAFVADLDTPPPWIITGVPSAPSVTRPPVPRAAPTLLRTSRCRHPDRAVSAGPR